QELMHEVAVGAVQFQHLEARRMRSPRALAPRLDQILDLMAFQRPGHRPFFAVGDRAGCNRRPDLPILDIGPPLQWAIALPRPVRPRLAPGMAELDAGDRALLVD